MELKQGDRVIHKHLGAGTFQYEDEVGSYAFVIFDNEGPERVQVWKEFLRLEVSHGTDR